MNDVMKWVEKGAISLRNILDTLPHVLSSRVSRLTILFAPEFDCECTPPSDPLSGLFAGLTAGPSPPCKPIFSSSWVAKEGRRKGQNKWANKSACVFGR